jgi:rhamnose transport system substrate-binding protein
MRLLLPLLALLLLAGCTPGDEPSGTPPPSPAPGPSGDGGRLKIGLMPKQVDIPYFKACEKGAMEAAAALGDVEVVYNGPLKDQSEQQSEMVESWITQRFDAIAVACNDPNQISPTLARARDQGRTVITYDADADPVASRRQFFVNQVEQADIARSLVDEMARQVGARADVAVVSSSSTAPNQSAWLKEMNAHIRREYPGIRIVTTEYAGEDQARSRQRAEAILKAYPNVKGIWGMTSVAFPGVAQAVEGAGQSGKIAVVGLSTPNSMREFVERGVVKSVILWNPVDLGYLTVYVARAAAKGELKPDSTSVEAGRLGRKEVKNGVVLLGKPMIFDRSNIGEFDF